MKDAGMKWSARPTHFITKYGKEVHEIKAQRLGAWVSKCGIYELQDSEYAHHGPATCARCINSRRKDRS